MLHDLLVYSAHGAVVALGFVLAAYVLYLTTNNASWIDTAWALGTGALAVLYAVIIPGAFERRLLVGIGGGAWGARLGLYLAWRTARAPEDPRYRTLRARWGGGEPRLRFLQFYLTQWIVIVVLGVPFLLVARDGSTMIGWPVIAGAVLFAIGWIGEAVSDAQLARFRAVATNRGRVCDTGLWARSRHPNYFFEWVQWCAFALIATASPGGWVAWIAPAMMYYFLTQVTGVPLTEAQSLASRGEAYRAYQARVPAFFPRVSR